MEKIVRDVHLNLMLHVLRIRCCQSLFIYSYAFKKTRTTSMLAVPFIRRSSSYLLEPWTVVHPSLPSPNHANSTRSAIHEQATVRTTRCPSRSNLQKFLEFCESTLLEVACGDESTACRVHLLEASIGLPRTSGPQLSSRRQRRQLFTSRRQCEQRDARRVPISRNFWRFASPHS